MTLTDLLQTSFFLVHLGSSYDRSTWDCQVGYPGGWIGAGNGDTMEEAIEAAYDSCLSLVAEGIEPKLYQRPAPEPQVKLSLASLGLAKPEKPLKRRSLHGS